MPHIKVPEGVPGILSLFAVRPETAKPLCELAEILLRGKSTLTPGERELIASHVSRLNDCFFCCSSHSAATKELLGVSAAKTQAIVEGKDLASISPKMQALLRIAAQVQKGGKSVQATDVDRAKKAGASDVEIHDAVLIAAAFCMYNRYVDGLATWAPTEPGAYDAVGKRLATEGYLTSAAVKAG